MKILLTYCHPRRASFTGAVADAFVTSASEAGHSIEFADLHAENFDPVLREPDEPDWDHPDKRYSDAVQSEMERVVRNQAIVLVFPVWWWSVPAMLKGWIDRVWNLGFAYGPAKLAHRHALLIGTASATAAQFEKRGYDQAIDTQLGLGVMAYCGIHSYQVALLHDTCGDDATRAALLDQARELGRNFPSSQANQPV